MDFSNLEHLKQVDAVCLKHNCHFVRLNKKVYIAGEKEPRKPAPYCPECQKESIAQKEQDDINRRLNRELYHDTYEVLERDSIVPKELKTASFDNFMIDSEQEQKFLEFARGQGLKYLDGMTGNTLITGKSGVGKSHLTYAMAKSINEGFRTKGDPKSVLFVTMTEIIKRIKEGWSYGQGAKLTEYEAVRWLIGVDFLFLDDLGAKNATVKAKSDWEQDFLYDILNNRETTIINTNLTSKELYTVYNERNASRILKGLEGNSYKVEGIKEKRYGIRRYKK